MPYTPTSPILTVVDAIVASVAADWGPTGPDEVVRLYGVPADAKSLPGRKVWIFPAEYDDEPATRSEDVKSYRVGVVVAERYADAGVPPVEWVDERVDWVHGSLLDWLEFLGTASNQLLSVGTREVYTWLREPVQVYDPAVLAQHKLFWSEMEFVFREVA